MVAIRVLIVEDALTNGGPLTRGLQRDGDIVVFAQTKTGAASIALVAREKPDVIILGLFTDDGTGQHFIEQVMARVPTPILVLSTRLTDRRSPSAVEALVAGALETQPAPNVWTTDIEARLRHTVRQISKVQTIRHPRGGLNQGQGLATASAARAARAATGQHAVVALAASTGGPTALATVLAGLGGLAAPVLVVQHLHPDFTSGLVDWMARASALPVEIAASGQIARPGHVYLAPGGVHLRLAAGLRLELATTPVTIHQPSADVLFRSVAEQAGAAAVGVILTGMGDDGARGLLEIHRQHGTTFGQDEDSCAVFGMPQAARAIGALTSLVPLSQIAATILRATSAVKP